MGEILTGNQQALPDQTINVSTEAGFLIFIVIIVSFPGNTHLSAEICHGNRLPGGMLQIFVETIFNLDLTPLGGGRIVDTIYSHKNHPLWKKPWDCEQFLVKIYL